MKHYWTGQVEDINYVREDTIKVDFRELGSQCVKWIQLAIQLRQCVKKTLTLWKSEIVSCMSYPQISTIFYYQGCRPSNPLLYTYATHFQLLLCI
jgi:hypothetical protein